jgi:alkyldihydroxyacetonephosphate synthase
MRRWNGWGEQDVDSPLPEGALAFLESRLGPALPPRDATLDQVLASVPASRLPAHPLVSDESHLRLLHARGQSLPDWVALRSGDAGPFPDGVARPTTESEVRTLIDFAREVGAHVIPYGGGTSVVGHVNVPAGSPPVLTLSLARLGGLTRFDEVSHLATFGAGVAGPDLEAQLRARGFTLGHFPQSFEYSTLGGWIATRSSGQESLGYGRIERLFAGGRLLAPEGTLELPPLPASAAGPDLKQLVLGSEGRLGILTEATVRVTPLPEREDFQALVFPGWEQGLLATREMIQARLPMSLLRLSTPAETETMFRLAGNRRLLGALESLLALKGAPRGEKCLLLVGLSGRPAVVKAAGREVRGLGARRRGIALRGLLARQWVRHRFRGPYLRNTLWERGYAVDTLETAVRWATLPRLMQALEGGLRSGLAEIGERVHVFAHVSHAYPDGGSLYVTYLFRLAPDPAETLRRWHVLKTLASRAIVCAGATISHQHGVGVDHLPYLPAEKGELGETVLRDVLRRFDPLGLMNPGKLVA